MKHPFLILVCCTILPGFALSQTDTAAAARDTAAAVRVTPPAAAADTAAVESEADVPGTWRFFASGGWTFPFEPEAFKDHFKTNYNFGEGVAYALPPGDVGYGEVSLVFHYYNVLFTNSGFRKVNQVPANASLYGYDGDIITGMAQFRGVLGSEKSVAPFFTAAFGLYHIELPAIGIVNSTELYPAYRKTTVCWSAGLGVDVPVADRFTLFADGRFLLGVTETNGHKLFAAGGGFRYRI